MHSLPSAFFRCKCVVLSPSVYRPPGPSPFSSVGNSFALPPEVVAVVGGVAILLLVRRRGRLLRGVRRLLGGLALQSFLLCARAIRVGYLITQAWGIVYGALHLQKAISH